MAKTWGRQEPLVEAHINAVSVRAIQRHRNSFRKFMGRRRSGVYVLRKDGTAYYIGLASSLRSRLPDHLKDHLRGKWNKFDLYIIRKSKAKYIKELETLLIRVAKPVGNRNEPKFAKHNNITKEFKRMLAKEISDLFSRDASW